MTPQTHFLARLFAHRTKLLQSVLRMSSTASPEKSDNLTQQFSDRLFDCAATGKVDEVKSLLGGAVSKDSKNERGWTALMFAARNGQLPVIEVLVEKGCDVNIMNASGQTALDIASFWNHTDSAAFLQKHSTHSPFDQAINYYSQNPLYRASELRKNAEWLEAAVQKENTKFVVFASDLRPFFIKGEGNRFRLAVMNHTQLSSCLAKKPDVVFLGLEAWDPHSSAWFALKLHDGEEDLCKEHNPNGYFAELFPRSRDVMMLEDTHAGIFAEAHSVLQWLDRYRFCPTCGTSTQIAEGGYKRVCDDKECRSLKGVHNTCYPRVDPSLIMLVVSPDNKRCLLGRQTRFPPKMYSCLAGFMEPGECIEDTCRREVQEESGVKVGRVEYHSSQPWPFPATLMLGCIAHARTEEIQIDPEELEDVRWFSRAEIAQMLAARHPDGLFLPPPTAIARQLVMSWVTRTANL
ncbi:NAD-capped RNA hydrolase NUDT12-like [Littorina saxatilis]|uniref:NAD-capped RNA hydrolase NUDT12 n=1 Tax=Littorina saxatilis TaxID=31220 RepID=A0AAN9GQN0_9CAEN